MPPVLQANGFWSYVHADDDAEEGRIFQLAHDVMAKYRLNTASDLELFLDLASIKWGEDWRDEIDTALRGVTFFIPILTPSYFVSNECRHELQEFARRADSAELGVLILPIYYIALPEDGLVRTSEDPAVALAARRQYKDWRQLRLADTTSSEHRTGVQGLVERLMGITREVSIRPEGEVEEKTRAEVKVALTAGASATGSVGPRPSTPETSPIDDGEPGVLELLALGEAALPQVTGKVNRLGVLFEMMSGLTDTAVARMGQADDAGKVFAGRVHQTHQLARELEPPAEEILTLGQEYSAVLTEADPGIRALLDIAESAAEGADRHTVCELFHSMQEMADSSRVARDRYEELIGTLAGVARFSRALRPPLAKVSDGIRLFADGHSVTEGWIAQIDDASVDCTDWAPPARHLASERRQD